MNVKNTIPIRFTLNWEIQAKKEGNKGKYMVGNNSEGNKGEKKGWWKNKWKLRRNAWT